jgi:hypothetical protein
MIEIVNAPEGSIVVIINNCGECDWHIKTVGRKFYCNHPDIHALRPYVEDTKDQEKSRVILNINAITEWCPLRKKGVVNGKEI